MTGAGRLARLVWRSDRWLLLLSAVGTAGLLAAVMSSVQDLYGGVQERAAYAATLGVSPATAAFNGRPFDLDRVGGVAVYEVGFFGLLLLPAVGVFVAVRHTRGQEDLGRADLVTSMRVGRMASLAAAAATGVVLALLIGTLLVAAGAAMGFEPAGTVRYGVVLALYLLWAGGVGLLAAQVAQSARTAYGLAFGLLGVTYLVRAVVDGLRWDLGWLTPMGWVAESRPFAAEPPWWPVAALAGAAVALHLAAGVVRSGRDLGAGVLPLRPGPAAGRVRGPAALAWRVTRGSASAWVVAAAAWGAGIGLLAEEMLGLLRSNPALTQVLLGGADAPEGVMTYLASILVAVMGAAVTLQGVSRFAAEESSGRLGAVVSTALSRTRWCVAAGVVVCVQAAATLAVGGLAFGVAADLTSAGASDVVDGPLTTLSYGSAVLLLAGVATLLSSVHPRLAALGWLPWAWTLVVALLADTLQLPEWARGLSPLDRLGELPMDDLPVGESLVMVGLAAGCAATALLLLRRRDLVAG